MEKETGSQNHRKYIINQITRLIIFLVILIGIVLTLILYFSWPLLTGKEIILATQPVDPFDILRGQYLTIRYDISQVPTIKGAFVGDQVYVTLKEDSSHIWRYEKVSLVKPEGDFIKGEITSIYGESMQIKYGIEQYFFERNAHIETRNMTIKVKIGVSGQARIVELMKDNKPLIIEYENFSITG